MTTDKEELLKLSDAIRNIELKINEVNSNLNHQRNAMVARMQEICPHPEILVETKLQDVTFKDTNETLEKEVSTCGYCKKVWIVEEEDKNNEKEKENE